MKKLLLLGLMASALFAEVNTGACVGCHGTNFEKSAMGKSKIVKDMEEQDVAVALIQYKYEGTFGGPMKGIMQGQVKNYTVLELLQVADKIGKDTDVR